MPEEYNSRRCPREQADSTPEYASNNTADPVGAKPFGLVAPKLKSVEHCKRGDCQDDEEPAHENQQQSERLEVGHPSHHTVDDFFQRRGAGVC